jgi:hypothetical protein
MTRREVCYIEIFNVEARSRDSAMQISLLSFVLNQRAGSCFVWLPTKQREFHRHVQRHYWVIDVPQAQAALEH